MGFCASHLVNNVRHYCQSYMASICNLLYRNGFPRSHFVDRCKPSTSVFVGKSYGSSLHYKTKTIFVPGPFFAYLSLWMQKSNDHPDSLALLPSTSNVFHLYFWSQNRSVTKVFGALHQLDLGEFLPNFVWNHFRVNFCLS